MRSVVGLSVVLLLLYASAFAQAPAGGASARRVKNSEFQVPAGLRPRVDFWKSIFARYGKNQVVIHHRRYPQAVFLVLDFSKEAESMGPVALEVHKERETARQIREIKEALRFLATGQSPRTPLERTIQEEMSFIAGGWTKYRAALADDLVRSQTGIREKMAGAIQRSGRYLPIIEKIFVKEHALPIELTRLPFVESSFEYKAYSSVGAAGIWQFMPRTARTYMTVNSLVDERSDPVESSQAAARYMISAYSRLGTWALAVTSYNHGMAGVGSKARKAGTTDIVRLIEGPGEAGFGFASANFWPSFLAALEVYDERAHWFPGVEPESGLRIAKMRLPRAITVGHLASQLNLQPEALRGVNYALTERIWSGRSPIPAGYVMKVPQEYGDRLARVTFPAPVIPTPLPGSSAIHGAEVYRVRQGDTLIGISKRFDLPVAELKALNNLKSKPLRAGQTLVVKKRAADGVADKRARSGGEPPKKGQSSKVYKVKAGDTLFSLAQRNGTTVQQLRARNKLRGDYLRPGQLLKIQ